MDYDDDRKESKCRSVGLKGFKEDPFIDECSIVVRALFFPSFTPAGCITISKSLKEGMRIHLDAHLGYSIIHYVGVFNSVQSLNEGEFDELWDAAQKLKPDTPLSENMAMMDGMTSYILVKSDSGVQVFETNACRFRGASSYAFLRLMLTMFWRKLNDDNCRDVIDILGRHVGLSFEPREI